MEEAGRSGVSGACRRGVAWTVVLGVAALHLFRIGDHLPGTLRPLYSSYASDILLPLAMYFVLCLGRRNLGFLRDWRARAVAVLAAASAAEVLQGLGVPALGRTFDPLDFVMYAFGVLAAVLLDRVVLPAP
jgi:hypothetical protein